MNIDREQVIAWAQEASNNCKDALLEDHNDLAMLYLDELEHFADLAYAAGLAAERNKLAAWMMQFGFATGHGDTTEDLLKELEWQIKERS